MDPVRNDVKVSGVRHDQRLVTLQPQHRERLGGRLFHFGPGRPLIVGPVERVVQDRLLQLPPPHRSARQPLEVGRGPRRRGHQPRSPSRIERRQVPGVGPIDPLVLLEAVRPEAGERAAEPKDLRDHQLPRWWNIVALSLLLGPFIAPSRNRTIRRLPRDRATLEDNHGQRHFGTPGTGVAGAVGRVSARHRGCPDTNTSFNRTPRRFHMSLAALWFTL